MIRLIGREFQSTQEIQRSKMRFGADIQQGPYRPPFNFDYPQREIGDNQQRFNPDLFDEYGGGQKKK